MPDPTSFLDLIGGFPDRPALDAEELSTVRADGYQRTLVEYTTAVGERVQAHLLIPGQAETRDHRYSSIRWGSSLCVWEE